MIENDTPQYIRVFMHEVAKIPMPHAAAGFASAIMLK